MTKNQKQMLEKNNYDGIEDEYATEFHEVEPGHFCQEQTITVKRPRKVEIKKQIIYPKRRYYDDTIAEQKKKRSEALR